MVPPFIVTGFANDPVGQDMQQFVRNEVIAAEFMKIVFKS
jgi:hypothetical protein